MGAYEDFQKSMATFRGTTDGQVVGRVQVSTGLTGAGLKNKPRSNINFLAGTNVTIAVADNTPIDSVDVTINATASGGTPAGSNTQIQYNNGGAFGASSGLTWNDTTKLLAISGSVAAGGSVRTSVTNSNSAGYADHYLFNNLGNFVGFQMAGSTVASAAAILATSATSYFNISTQSNVPMQFSVTGSAGECGRWSAAANWLVGVTADTGITGAGGIRTKNTVLVGDGTQAGTYVNINSSSFALLQYSIAGVSKYSTGVASAVNQFITGSAANDFCFKSDASANILFSTDNGTSIGSLFIASTGVFQSNKGINSFAGTVTTSRPVLDATQTWNAGAVTFTGLKLNVTNTASAAASLLMDLQLGAASVFSVGKSGSIKVTAPSANATALLSSSGGSGRDWTSSSKTTGTFTIGSDTFADVLSLSGTSWLMGGGAGLGGGSLVLSIANATTVPTTNPTGGGILYCSAGALVYRGSSGTVTTIALA